MSFFPQSFYGGYGFGSYAYNQPVAQLLPAELPEAAPAEPAEPRDPLDRQSSWVIAGRGGWYPGFDKAPPPGAMTWWMMRRYATIVLAHTVVTAPILAGTQTVECDEGDTEAEGWKGDAEKDLLLPLADALPAALECLHFSNWLQEVVWGERDGRIVPTEFVSLLPGEAVIYRDRYGKFAGFKVNQEERDARYAFLAVNEPHLDPIFGYSRNENCREEWWRARESNKNADRIENKASGIQMKIAVPMGQTFVDDKGNPVMGKPAVQAIVDAAAQGQSFTVPLTPFRKDDIARNPELAGIEAVKVEAFDWKDNAPTLLAHLARISDLNRDIMRAWHRPEREATEGQHGTKAEAVTHGAIGTTDSELVAGMVLRQFNRQVTDRYLVTNHGHDALGRLRVVQAPLSDPQQEFFQTFAQTLATDSATGPEISANVNQRGLLERLEVPLKSEEDVAKAKAEAQAAQDAKDKARADQLQQMQQNPATQLQNVPVKIAASGNGHPKIGAVELFNRVLELGRDE